MSFKKQYLLESGWREYTKDCWQGSVTFTDKFHYFTLENAYALETDGIGIYAYSLEESFASISRNHDIMIAETKELQYFLSTGRHHGQPPNY